MAKIVHDVKVGGAKVNTAPTNTLPSGKWCNWVFTGWDDEEPEFKPTIMKYLAYERETCPSTGKKHWQGYIGFVNAIVAKGVITRLGFKTHPYIDVMHGNLNQNAIYCSKEKNLTKHGQFPRQGARTDIEEFRDHIIHGEMTVDDIAINAPFYHYQYGRTFDKIEDITMRKKFRTEMTKGIWYYGKTGVGKSHKAFENFSPATHYVLNINDNGWWEGYKQQDTVIINEFRGQIPYGELLDLVDKWPKSVKRRNREPMPFISKTLIITSSMHPAEVYKNIVKGPESIQQLERRFEIILMDRKTDETSASHEVLGGVILAARPPPAPEYPELPEISVSSMSIKL